MFTPGLQFQRLNAEGLHNALEFLKGWVFLAALDAGVVVSIEVGGGSDCGLGQAGLFTGLPELFAELFAWVFLIFCSHIWITIPFQGDCRHA